MIITINFSLIFSMNVYCLENPIDTGAWQATVHGVARVGHDLMTKPQYMLLNIGGSDGKESACSAGDLGSIPGLGRFPGEGNGNPLQYSCLKNPMDRGAWQATVHGVLKSQLTLLLSLHYK